MSEQEFPEGLYIRPLVPKSFYLFIDSPLLLKISYISIFSNRAELVPGLCKSSVGVVLPEKKSVLCSRCHDPVRLIRSLGHKIVYQHPDICLIASEHQRGLSSELSHRIYTCDEALCRSFFVTRAAIELPGAEKAFHQLAFQARLQRKRVYAVVLNSIRGA